MGGKGPYREGKKQIDRERGEVGVPRWPLIGKGQVSRDLLRKPADRLGKVVLANEVSIRGSGGWSSRVARKSRN